MASNPKPRPWERDATYYAPSYYERQWNVVRKWVMTHVSLIRQMGLLKAQYVARLPPSRLTLELENEGWSPLCGLRPTKEQIGELMRSHASSE